MRNWSPVGSDRGGFGSPRVLLGLTLLGLLVAAPEVAAQSKVAAPSDSKSGPKLESSRLLSPLSLGPFTSELDTFEPATQTSATQPSFQQTLQLQPYGGTSSKLELELSGLAPLESARLIAVVDGVLRVVPFVGLAKLQAGQKSPDRAASSESAPPDLLGPLVARFLTPTRTLQYQLQFLFTDGRSQLTKWFSLSDSCFQRVPVQELIGVPEERQRLIAELVALDRDAARLTHALSSIQKLVEAK